MLTNSPKSVHYTLRPSASISALIRRRNHRTHRPLPTPPPTVINLPQQRRQINLSTHTRRRTTHRPSAHGNLTQRHPRQIPFRKVHRARPLRHRRYRLICLPSRAPGKFDRGIPKSLLHLRDVVIALPLLFHERSVVEFRSGITHTHHTFRLVDDALAVTAYPDRRRWRSDKVAVECAFELADADDRRFGQGVKR